MEPERIAVRKIRRIIIQISRLTGAFRNNEHLIPGPGFTSRQTPWTLSAIGPDWARSAPNLVFVIVTQAQTMSLFWLSEQKTFRYFFRQLRLKFLYSSFMTPCALICTS